MLNFQYKNDTKNYNVTFEKLSENHVKIMGDIPLKTNGFILTRINEPDAFTGDYSDYTTIYKAIDNGVIFSNDGTKYVEPVPVVNFYTNGGGVLDGAISQEVKTYEELLVPTPIAYENYEFLHWSPDIPESGEVETLHKSFAAIFVSTLPEPDPVPTIEERLVNVEKGVTELKSNVKDINAVLINNI